MTLAPYWKILIHGLVITGCGGSFWIVSILIRLMEKLNESAGSSYDPWMGKVNTVFIGTYSYAGLVLLCVGVPILIAGLFKRSKYKSGVFL